MEQPHANQCTAKSKRSGKQCRNYAMPNGKCRMHGGKSTGAPAKNDNAQRHGLYSRYLPKETLDIMDEIEKSDPLEILWTNIKMQYASIIRAQQIMYVENKYETTRELKKLRFKDGVTEDGKFIQVPSEKEYEIQFAWDKQASFMNSLSRSMGELRNMLKQYVELANYDDDRALEIKRIQAMIDKSRAESEKLKSDKGQNLEVTIVDKWTEQDED